jgi:hypothetical protein
MTDYNNEDAGLPAVAEQSIIATLNRSEIDQQITTAKQYPRSVVKFRKEALEMVTLNERVAESCIYALPRDGKTIEGPSARFAEVIASAWGNCRAGARVVSEQGDFVTAQGVFHDLERNVAITYEVQRRITGKSGKRFGADMVGVTANAACSIALRNAILKGVPKAFWDDLYEAARQVIRGDFKTLNNRRAETLAKFLGYGVNKEQVCTTLGVAGIEDIGLDELVILRGILTAIREGDTTPEMAFAVQENGAKKPPVYMPESKTAPREPDPSPTPPEKAEPRQPLKSVSGTVTSQPLSNSSLASEGEKTYLKGKIKALHFSMDEVLKACGISDFDSLTADGFIAIKEHLAEQAGA